MQSKYDIKKNRRNEREELLTQLETQGIADPFREDTLELANKLYSNPQVKQALISHYDTLITSGFPAAEIVKLALIGDAGAERILLLAEKSTTLKKVFVTNRVLFNTIVNNFTTRDNRDSAIMADWLDEILSTFAKSLPAVISPSSLTLLADTTLSKSSTAITSSVLADNRPDTKSSASRSSQQLGHTADHKQSCDLSASTPVQPVHLSSIRAHAELSRLIASTMQGHLSHTHSQPPSNPFLSPLRSDSSDLSYSAASASTSSTLPDHTDQRKSSTTFPHSDKDLLETHNPSAVTQIAAVLSTVDEAEPLLLSELREQLEHVTKFSQDEIDKVFSMGSGFINTANQLIKHFPVLIDAGFSKQGLFKIATCGPSKSRLIRALEENKDILKKIYRTDSRLFSTIMKNFTRKTNIHSRLLAWFKQVLLAFQNNEANISARYPIPALQTDKHEDLITQLKEIEELNNKDDLEFILKYQNGKNFKSSVQALCQHYEYLRDQRFDKQDILHMALLNTGASHLRIIAQTNSSELAQVSLAAVVKIFKTRMKIDDKVKAFQDLLGSAKQQATTLPAPARSSAEEKVREVKTTHKGHDALSLPSPLTPKPTSLEIPGPISDENGNEDEQAHDPFADQEDHPSTFDTTDAIFTGLAPLTPIPQSRLSDDLSSLSFALPDTSVSLARKRRATETDTTTDKRPKTSGSSTFFPTQNRLMPPPPLPTIALDFEKTLSKDQLILLNALKELKDLSETDLAGIFKRKNRKNFTPAVKAFCEYYPVLKNIDFPKEIIIQLGFTYNSGPTYLKIIAQNESRLAGISVDKVVKIFSGEKSIRKKQKAFERLLPPSDSMPPPSLLSMDLNYEKTLSKDQRTLLNDLKKLRGLSATDYATIFRKKKQGNFATTVKAFCECYELLKIRNFSTKDIIFLGFTYSSGAGYLKFIAKIDRRRLARTSVDKIVNTFRGLKPINEKKKALENLLKTSEKSAKEKAHETTALDTVCSNFSLSPPPTPQQVDLGVYDQISDEDEQAHDLFTDEQDHPDAIFADLAPLTPIPAGRLFDDPSSIPFFAQPDTLASSAATETSMITRKQPRTASSPVEMAAGTATEHQVKRPRTTSPPVKKSLQQRPLDDSTPSPGYPARFARLFSPAPAFSRSLTPMNRQSLTDPLAPADLRTDKNNSLK